MHWLYELAHSSTTIGKLTFAVVMVALFFGVLGLLLLLIDRAPRAGRDKVQAALFLLPAAVLLLIGLIGPIIRTLISSLTSAEVDRPNCVPIPSPAKCVADPGG